MAITSIMTDSREPEDIQKLTFGGVPKLVVALDAGDLLVACDDNALLAIERKTATDFLNTLRDDRLFPQLAKLRQVTSWAYLFLTGQLEPGPGGKCWADSRETGWNWASASGALTTVQEMGICVVQCNEMDYEQAIIRLANRDRSTMRIKAARDTSIISEPEAILSALPGIGAEKAGVLLQHSGTVATALQLLTDPTIDPKIPGIGEGIRRRVRKALALETDYMLAEVPANIHNVDDCVAFLKKHGIEIPGYEREFGKV